MQGRVQLFGHVTHSIQIGLELCKIVDMADHRIARAVRHTLPAPVN